VPLSGPSPRVFTAEEVTRRLTKATGGVAGNFQAKDTPKRWSTTADVVTNLVGFIRNPAERWYLGIPEVDIASRGVGRGEVLMVVGRSHTGKSQVLLNGIVTNLVNNPAAHVVIFSMDEPRELVVMKLYCLLRGKSSTEVEEAVKAGDKEVIADLERAANEELSRIAIVDESIPLPVMADVLDEAREWWGCDPSFTMIDYLELLPGGDSDSTGVTSKAQAVKRWAKTQRVPVGLVHQAGRGSGEKGKPAGLYAGRYGGEQEAIFVLEVYRQKDRQDLSEWEKEYHAHSINLNLCKNKRTARMVDQVYYIDPLCGQVHPYWEELIPGSGGSK
jgi:KaiC/GvpD/RAD55 family RecA-like ATPase